MDVVQDQEIFERYKPLRNHIRKLCLADSLAVIRAYVENLQFGTPIPGDCEVNAQYAHAQNKLEKAKWITEFHLETLCREVLLHAADLTQCPETLRSWNTLARAINKLKELEEFIGERFLTPNLLVLELHRTAHRQFPWQMSRPKAPNIMRYFLIYKYPPLENIIQGVTRLTVEELFLMGMALLGNFTINFALFYPPNIQIPGLSNNTLDRFLGHFSTQLSDLKERLKTEQQMNDRFVYAYHSLRAYPLIRMNFRGRDSVVCPLPTILFWRFTSGVYYEICKQSGFANAFGDAFQSYVGRVLKEGTTPSKTRIQPEDQYFVGKDLKRTVDWIMDQEGSALFIEAKTKRMVMEAKVEIGSQGFLSAELDKMADMIIQVYKSIRDYRDDRYPNYRFSENRQIFPVIVTLEDWFLMGPKLLTELDSKVTRGLEAEGVPTNWMAKMPYTVCSVNELEGAVQVMDRVGIRTVLYGKAFDAAKREWTLGAYLDSDFKDHIRAVRFLFPGEYDALDVEALKRNSLHS